VHNDLALRNAPEIAPRNDELAGPKGRRGDVVGAPYFMSVADARRVAPLWHRFTVKVRNDSKVGPAPGLGQARMPRIGMRFARGVHMHVCVCVHVCSLFLGGRGWVRGRV
jgi:hypothetical protein